MKEKNYNLQVIKKPTIKQNKQKTKDTINLAKNDLVLPFFDTIIIGYIFMFLSGITNKMPPIIIAIMEITPKPS